MFRENRRHLFIGAGMILLANMVPLSGGHCNEVAERRAPSDHPTAISTAQKSSALGGGEGIVGPKHVLERRSPAENTHRSLSDIHMEHLETERDFMEEAVALLNESQTYWANGQLEEALEILDQAYAVLLEANGNPDAIRQKDDLRLMISKKILAIYNSNQAVSQGKRSEIPVTINSDVEKEIRQFQTVEREFFISSYQRSLMYRSLIVKELKKAGLPEELSWLPLVESGFKVTALSPARALGLWQFIPSTGYKYGLNRDDWVDERMDMEKSTRAAIAYLKDLHDMFGDWLTVLAAYNCGEGRIMRTIASQHINYLDRFWDLYHRLPYETARYVPRFLATLIIINNPEKYGINLQQSVEQYPVLSFETVEINKSMRVANIARSLEVSEDLLHILNAELRHKITPDRSYRLRVPREAAEKLNAIIDTIPLEERPRTSYALSRGVIKHRVKRGETLAMIAKNYETTVFEIRSANKFSSKQSISVGQSLIIPARKMGKNIEPIKARGDRPIQHTVKKGETLTAIANQYGLTIEQVKGFNSLRTNDLKTGQVLLIQERGVKSSDKVVVTKHIVQKGDTLAGIAAKYNVSLSKIKSLNGGMAKNDTIQPGQVIVVR